MYQEDLARARALHRVFANRPPGPHSARLALIPRPNRASEGGIQSDLLAVHLGVPDCATRIREIVLEECTGAS